MKNLTQRLKIVSCSLLMLLFVCFASCKKNGHPVAPPVKPVTAGCRLIRSVNKYHTIYYQTSTATVTGEVTYQTDYVYDANGNETQISENVNDVYSDGPTGNYTSAQVFAYDSDNFLKGFSYDSQTKDRGNIEWVHNIDKYTYSNGLVSGHTSQITSSTSTASIEENWLWDSNGALAGFNRLDYNQLTKFQFAYTGGKITKVTRTDHTGAVNYPPIEYDGEGRITRLAYDTDSERRYQYDADGDVIRDEYWTKGALVNVTLYTYDDKKLAPQYTFSRYKGFPENYPTTTYPYSNQPRVHNVLTATYQLPAGAGTFKVTAVHKHNYTYTDTGYAATDREDIYDGGSKLTDTYNWAYTYDSCH